MHACVLYNFPSCSRCIKSWYFGQKYRLHTRRPNPADQSSSSRPQFVLVGGLVVPPASPPGGNGACAPPNEIYAPVASRPSGLRSQQRLRSGIRPSHSGGRCSEAANSMADDDSASPTTSASSQTTTASPPFWLYSEIFDGISVLSIASHCLNLLSKIKCTRFMLVLLVCCKFTDGCRLMKNTKDHWVHLPSISQWLRF